MRFTVARKACPARRTRRCRGPGPRPGSPVGTPCPRASHRDASCFSVARCKCRSDTSGSRVDAAASAEQNAVVTRSPRADDSAVTRSGVFAWLLASLAVAAIPALLFLESGAEEYGEGWPANLLGAVAILASTGIGLLLALRRHTNPIGWLLLANAIVLAACRSRACVRGLRPGAPRLAGPARGQEEYNWVAVTIAQGVSPSPNRAVVDAQRTRRPERHKPPTHRADGAGASKPEHRHVASPRGRVRGDFERAPSRATNGDCRRTSCQRNAAAMGRTARRGLQAARQPRSDKTARGDLWPRVIRSGARRRRGFGWRAAPGGWSPRQRRARLRSGSGRATTRVR